MKRLFLHACLFLSVTTAAFGQKPATEEIFSDLSLEDLLNIEVTVASKSEATSADAPSSVTVFSRTELQNMGITTLNEFLNYVPGFQASRDVTNGQEAAVSSRNVSSGQLSYHVLVLENGVRLNDSHAGGASLFTRLISLDNIKQIEVIRGPGSALYGSNAFLGVINIVTVDDVNEAKFNFGELSSRHIAINFSKTFSEWRLSAFASAFSDHGEFYPQIGPSSVGELGTSDPREGMDAQIRAKFRGLTLIGRFRQRSFRDFYQFGVLGNNVNRDEEHHNYLAFHYDAINDEKSKLQISGAWVEGGYDARALLAPSGAPPFLSGDFIGGPIQEHLGRNLSADFQRKLREDNTLNAGITFRQAKNERADSVFNYNPVTGEYLGFQQPVFPFNRTDDTRDVIGIYLQDQHSFNERVKLILGIRFDDYRDVEKRQQTVNPRGALIFDTPFDGKLKIMYGEAFRAPSLNELYNVNNPVAVGNPDLEPERVDTIELAYVQSYQSFFQSTLTFYHNKITDIIVLGPDPAGLLATPIYANRDKSEVEGLEFEIQSALGSNLLLRVGYSEILSGESDVLPDSFGSFVLNCNVKQLNFNINAIYRDRIRNLENQGSYWVSNAKFRYDIAPKFTIHLSAQNLFDEDYREFTAVIAEGVPGRGRVVMLGGTWQY